MLAAVTWRHEECQQSLCQLGTNAQYIINPPNVSKSNTHDVTLFNVSRQLTGEYKCEVSGGSPLYHTDIRKARMEVVDAPKTDPTIGIEKERIAVGELLRANCTTGNSRPASAITWKLNGDLIGNDSMVYRTRHLAIPQDDGSQVSKSTIDFKVTNDMFQNGRLHLRCTAFIADVYRKTADIEISEDAPRIASITGESPPRGHHSLKERRKPHGILRIIILALSSMS
ncbi:uncharacterized protein LOC143220655 [Lasioglossum baleicum]|uniref:uncharacterized protein LOC143220655 n=1 Tax=Lasioglossum baleicum TaxID=434251 RepID=UPI003FCDDA32